MQATIGLCRLGNVRQAVEVNTRKRLKIRRILKKEFNGTSKVRLQGDRERLLARLRILAYKFKILKAKFNGIAQNHEFTHKGIFSPSSEINERVQVKMIS